MIYFKSILRHVSRTTFSLSSPWTTNSSNSILQHDGKKILLANARCPIMGRALMSKSVMTNVFSNVKKKHFIFHMHFSFCTLICNVLYICIYFQCHYLNYYIIVKKPSINLIYTHTLSTHQYEIMHYTKKTFYSSVLSMFRLLFRLLLPHLHFCYDLLRRTTCF